jgi:hypothetical protein
MGSKPTARVVEQRIRNRVIEYLDLAASFDEQRKYAQQVPSVNVPNEVINMWEDNFPRDPRSDSNVLALYSSHEVGAIRRFHQVCEAVAEQVPDDWPTLEEAQGMSEWGRLREEAAAARQVFARRGRMPEDLEVDL